MERIEQMDKNIRENNLPEGEDRKAYMAYREGLSRNLDCPDIADIVWDREVEPIVNTFKKYGITKFTYSSTASGAIETAMMFVKAGCALDGIRDNFYSEDYRYNMETKEYEPVNLYRSALVFSIYE